MTLRAYPRLLTAALLATSLLAAVCSTAHAGIVIVGTRVIYRGSEPETVVKLNNQGDMPGLAQVWLDRGDPNAPPATVDVPFTVMPPVSRIDPGKAQTLRILYTGETLPTDKESVFWLNVLEVPPKAARKPGEENALTLAFRTRIKLFYRPVSLQGDPAQAPSQLSWRLVQAGSQPVLEVSNPTPYHVTIAELVLRTGDRQSRFDAGEMVPPGESRRLSLKGEAGGSGGTGGTGGAAVEYHVVNDFGARVTLQGKLQPALTASR